VKSIEIDFNNLINYWSNKSINDFKTKNKIILTSIIIIMLFDFQQFIEELRQKPDKKQVVEKYEKLFGSIQGGLEEQQRFTEYVTFFNPIEFAVPDELKEDFDWGLLMKLVTASFSSDYELKKVADDKKERDLFIAVKSGDQSVVKTVSELRSFQVLRLYEIYIEEQMNLHSLKYEDEKEKDAIDQEREMRKKKWKAVMETLDRVELQAQAKEEQEEKLESLYDQL